jgi:hypothetical protein
MIHAIPVRSFIQVRLSHNKENLTRKRYKNVYDTTLFRHFGLILCVKRKDEDDDYCIYGFSNNLGVLSVRHVCTASRGWRGNRVESCTWFRCLA